MSVPIIITEKLSVARMYVPLCKGEEFIKAGIEVEDLIISTIRRVYSGCEEYGQKPNYVVVACNEGTFIMRLPLTYASYCLDIPHLIGPAEVNIEAKTYAHSFATFLKELAKTIGNDPNFKIKLETS